MLRRQLSVAERAMVAGKLANMSHGGDRSEQSPNLDDAPSVSLSDAAKKLNVSRACVAEVRKLKNEAPEVYAKLERGEIKSINGQAAAHMAAALSSLLQVASCEEESHSENRALSPRGNISRPSLSAAP